MQAPPPPSTHPGVHPDPPESSEYEALLQDPEDESMRRELNERLAKPEARKGDKLAKVTALASNLIPSCLGLSALVGCSN